MSLTRVFVSEQYSHEISVSECLHEMVFLYHTSVVLTHFSRMEFPTLAVIPQNNNNNFLCVCYCLIVNITITKLNLVCSVSLWYFLIIITYFCYLSANHLYLSFYTRNFVSASSDHMSVMAGHDLPITYECFKQTPN